MTDINRPLRVFICHSSKDKTAVRELHKKLHQYEWIDSWLDEEKLLPGQDWRVEVEKAVEIADVVLVLLSNQSVLQGGYVNRELKLTLDIADEKPEGTIFIIPIRLDECATPRRLRGWQYVDYFPANRKDLTFERVVTSLKLRAEALNLTFEVKVSAETPSPKPSPFGNAPVLTNGDVIGNNAIVEINKQPNIVEEKKISVENPYTTTSNKLTLSNGMEFVHVPAGEFLMGSKKDNRLADEDEHTQHAVNISYDYWIARFPVTNEQYNQYVISKKLEHPVSKWTPKQNHPVVSVSWVSARAYCQWLGNLLKVELPKGLTLRLPSEAEWEKAARGTKGSEWPWGNIFDASKCNMSENLLIETFKHNTDYTTLVGKYSPQGDSPFGCADMAGNVWEWTHSLYKNYPYNVSDGREDETDDFSNYRVMRGGAFVDRAKDVRCACRARKHFERRDFRVGFRVVISHSFF